MFRILITVFLLSCINVYSQINEYSEQLLLMGSRFELTAFADNKDIAREAVKDAIAEIRRIEALISEYEQFSVVSEINTKAGIAPVKVNSELFNLIERCIRVSRLTEGAFDITWATLNGLWKFDGSMTVIPSEEDIVKKVSICGFSNIILNSEDLTVFLKNPGMKIGFGAIGKGYAANKGMQAMKKHKITGGIVIAGGDLITWGKPENSEHWVIGIADPENPDKALAWLNVDEMAVVTSGNYEKFVIIDGKRYSHILDPRTGYPVSGLKSVTIICPDAELADALATAVFVMGKDNGLNMINQMKGIECLIIDENNMFYTSSGMILNYYPYDSEYKKHTILIGE